MRHFFMCALVSMVASGCYLVHERRELDPPGSDAGPMVGDSAPSVSDAWTEPPPDAWAEPDVDVPVCSRVLPNYRLEMDAMPMSSTVTAGATHVPSIGITYTAPPDSGLSYSVIVIQGRGNTDGTWQFSHFRDIVTTCSLYQGDTFLGTNMPDENGLIFTGGWMYTLAAGESVDLQIRCNTDTSVAQPMGDRYAVALAGAVPGMEPIMAMDDNNCQRAAIWVDPLIGQLQYAEPELTVTVLPP